MNEDDHDSAFVLPKPKLPSLRSVTDKNEKYYLSFTFQELRHGRIIMQFGRGGDNTPINYGRFEAILMFSYSPYCLTSPFS
jgi:hypothetical protein